MASVTILSDNGATSGSAGLKTSGGNDGTMLFQTTTSGGTPTTAISISNTQVVTFTNQPTYTGGTANGVLYLNGSKAVTSGTALVFDGTNLGVGVTPSAWNSDYKSVAVSNYAEFYGRVATPSVGVSYNVYRNSGGSWIYKTTNAAARYEQDSGYHLWYTAGSGTAGATASFTQAMTLDASGNLGVGTTSPNARLHLNTSSSSIFLTLQCAGGYGYLFNDGTYVSLASDIGSTGVKFRVARAAPDNAATIDSNGNLLVGVTSGSSKVRILGTGTTTPALSFSGGATNYAQNISAETGLLGTSYGTISMGVSNPGNGYYISFTAPDGSYNYAIRGSIALSGTSIAYNTSSDYRLKKDIAPMTGALAKVALLKPVTYKWLDDSDGEGFIAHELAEVVPQCVTGEKDAVDVDGNPVYQGIDTSFLVATLVKAIQEQQAIITQLQADVAALKGQA